MSRPVYQAIAAKIAAIKNCEKSGNWEWKARHTEVLEILIHQHLPSGSGFDATTEIDVDRSSDKRIIVKTDFHHMNDGGFYDGWTEHEIHITASLMSGFDLKITGRDRNGIKDYIADAYQTALTAETEN